MPSPIMAKSRSAWSQSSYAKAQDVMDQLAALGIDYDDVIATLEREGVDKFEASALEMQKSVETQLGAARTSRANASERIRRRSMSEVEGAAGLSVRGADAVPGAAAARQELSDHSVAGLLAEKDPTLWGKDAEAEAEVRLGWVDTFRRSRDLLPRLAELRRELAGLDHIVLAGMGGSSLAPEVIARTLGVELDGARYHRPAPGAQRPGRPARPYGRGRVQQVWLHCGD